MRLGILALTLALALVAGAALAQEPPLPAATSTPVPSPSASARPELNIPDIPIEPSPLVPNATPAPKKNVPSIQELDTAFQHSSLGAAVEQQRLHVEFRKLKNRASDDPEVVAAKKAMKGGRTDPEKRELMRAYYRIYYAHMMALAETPEMKTFLEERKRETINSLGQPNLRPTPSPSSKKP